MSRPGKIERLFAAVLPVVLAAAVFAVAFDHVRQVAAWAGQAGWYSVVIASTAEVMAVAALLEIRARRAAGESARWPVLVLVAAVGWSAACNLRAAAGLTGEPGAWRYVMAAWTVAAFGFVAGIKATRTHPAVEVEELEEVSPAVVAGPAPAPAPVSVEVLPVAVETVVAAPAVADPVADKVAELLPAALDVARQIGHGAPPSGRALVKAMRAAEHKVPNRVVTPLAEAVAEQWGVAA